MKSEQLLNMIEKSEQELKQNFNGDPVAVVGHYAFLEVIYV